MRYKNLFLLIVLIIVWSLFFAVYKYFIWGIFKTDIITLQYISGYLSLGTIGAYIFGGLFYELFKEKKYHLATIISTIFLLLLIYTFSKYKIFSNTLIVGGMTLFIGLYYGLWGVLRNILISSQIEEGQLSDTKINGIANISFITSIIIGSIYGGIIAEKIGLSGIFVIIGILIVGLFASFFMIIKKEQDKKSIREKATEYKNNYLNDFKFIIKKYFIIMLFVSLIITIATILSQKAIEYNVEVLKKSGSSSALILLFSAVGSIIGNLSSMAISKNRWNYFFLYSILFAIICVLFPTFLSNFIYISILATVAGLFFGISYNLLESYFFKKIAEDNKKSYGSASLGIVTSTSVALLMFLVDFIQKLFGFSGVYYFMGGIIFIIGIYIYLQKESLN